MWCMPKYTMKGNVKLISSISYTKDNLSESMPQLYGGACLTLTSPDSTAAVKWTLCPQENKNICQEYNWLSRLAALVSVAIVKDFAMEMKSKDHLRQSLKSWWVEGLFMNK